MATTRDTNSNAKYTEVFSKDGPEEIEIEEVRGTNPDNKADGSTPADKRNGLPPMQSGTEILYTVNEVPPVHLTILLGIQHFLTMFGGVISLSLLVAQKLCMNEDPVAVSRFLGTSFFVYGLVTLLQTTFGVRLPIIQGGAFSFVVPIFAIAGMRGECPAIVATNSSENINETLQAGTINGAKEYEIRIREIQGALMAASCVQVLVGFTGIMGYILRFVGPMTIAPITALIGLSLFEPAAYESGLHWGIAILTIFLIILFSQYMTNLEIPCVGYSQKKFSVVRFPIFKLFPIILAIVTVWLICLILTAADALPKDPGMYGYAARTDRNPHVLSEAPWFAIPYPGQWGRPTLSVGSTFGILAGILASMVESVGDYYACARLCGAPPPPQHAVNRGIGIEGIGCILCGAFGTSSGSTSFSENIGAIGITKVGSRVVVQAAGMSMVILGLFTKFSAIFTTIPIPIVGGVLCCTFGMVTAVGISNLQYVNLNSSRNLLILGFSILMGLVVPHWIMKHPTAIDTSFPEINQIINVLLSTGMFVGGFLAFFLDNTISGTPEDRGLLSWRKQYGDSEELDQNEDADDKPRESNPALASYDLPLISKYIISWNWTKYLPFCPTYEELHLRNPVDICKKKGTYQV